MELVDIHYRIRDKSGKSREGTTVFLIVEESDGQIAGVKSNLISEAAARVIRESPEYFAAMPPKEAVEWLKKEASHAYRKDWRKFPIRKHDHGLGVKIIERYKFGGAS